MQLTLVVIGKDEASLKHFDWSDVGDYDELILVSNDKKEPLSAIANRYLLHSREVFGLCHADAWFGTGSLEIFTKTALEGKVCGIVGKSLSHEYLWCHTNPGVVSTLDSCAIFLPVGCKLRFDDRMFNGFHCHVEDMCLQAQEIGIEVVVPAATASHRDSAVKDERWLSDYWRYRGLLASKWHGICFATT